MRGDIKDPLICKIITVVKQVKKIFLLSLLKQTMHRDFRSLCLI